LKKIMSGNEAIARGAYEAGVSVAAAYPGTPSTEILENIAQYPSIRAQWSPNEKVALEVGIGASLAGARVLVAMKHVGLNVAADPWMTIAYTGVNGGLVLVSADDPGMHSSQNEQDNRFYARMAGVPLLEPADSQEAKEFVRLALEISEEYDTPVLLRITTRIAHSKGLVELGERKEHDLRPYIKDPKKYVMIPGNARGRHVAVVERLAKLARLAEEIPINKVEMRGKLGVITSGVCYQYVREVLPEASVFKLGLTYPLPEDAIRAFAERVDELFVIEELEPFLEEQIRAMGIRVKGKELTGVLGELNQKRLAVSLGLEEPPPAVDVPPRPPVLCPGCPHRGVFYVLRRLRLTVLGDIGCYSLGALPPLDAMDTCICMGASIGSALGMEKADSVWAEKSVAVIGDSTFLHSGMTPLLDVVYNGGRTTVLILDNSTTAMTGHQDHPGTGRTLGGEAAPKVDLEKLVRALGVRRIRRVDAYDLDSLRRAVREEIEAPEPSVIIVTRPCALKVPPGRPSVVDEAKCNNCGLCLRLGCPAIQEGAWIDSHLCRGCGLCREVCPREAIGGDADVQS